MQCGRPFSKTTVQIDAKCHPNLRFYKIRLYSLETGFLSSQLPVFSHLHPHPHQPKIICLSCSVPQEGDPTDHVTQVGGPADFWLGLTNKHWQETEGGRRCFIPLTTCFSSASLVELDPSDPDPAGTASSTAALSAHETLFSPLVPPVKGWP